MDINIVKDTIWLVLLLAAFGIYAVREIKEALK